MTVALLISYLAAAFSAAALLMTRMIPLRLMIIVSNVLSIVYALMIWDVSLAALHCVLLPLNIYRLHQMRVLVKHVEAASDGVVTKEWLTTFMSRRAFNAGDFLFHKGDAANEVFYLVSGQYRVTELQLDLALGTMVGEVGLLAPLRERSRTIQCLGTGEVLVATYDEVNELFFQNPEFGYHFLKVASLRLFSDLKRMEAEIMSLRRNLRTAD